MIRTKSRSVIQNVNIATNPKIVRFFSWFKIATRRMRQSRRTWRKTSFERYLSVKNVKLFRENDWGRSTEMCWRNFPWKLCKIEARTVPFQSGINQINPDENYVKVDLKAKFVLLELENYREIDCGIWLKKSRQRYEAQKSIIVDNLTKKKWKVSKSFDEISHNDFERKEVEIAPLVPETIELFRKNKTKMNVPWRDRIGSVLDVLQTILST